MTPAIIVPDNKVVRQFLVNIFSGDSRIRSSTIYLDIVIQHPYVSICLSTCRVNSNCCYPLQMSFVVCSAA